MISIPKLKKKKISSIRIETTKDKIIKKKLKKLMEVEGFEHGLSTNPF